MWSSKVVSHSALENALLRPDVKGDGYGSTAKHDAKKPTSYHLELPRPNVATPIQGKSPNLSIYSHLRGYEAPISEAAYTPIHQNCRMPQCCATGQCVASNQPSSPETYWPFVSPFISVGGNDVGDAATEQDESITDDGETLCILGFLSVLRLAFCGTSASERDHGPQFSCNHQGRPHCRCQDALPTPRGERPWAPPGRPPLSRMVKLSPKAPTIPEE